MTRSSDLAVHRDAITVRLLRHAILCHDLLVFSWNVREDLKTMDLSLGDRLAHGNLTVQEVVVLRGTSVAGFYADLKKGLVSIRKLGRKTVVAGPVAKAYIEGRDGRVTRL